MKYTPNYNLRKPDPTDTVNIEDFNASFDLVDEKLGGLDNTFNQLIINAGSSNAEIVAARGTEVSLPIRMDKHAAELAEIATETIYSNKVIVRHTHLDKHTTIGNYIDWFVTGDSIGEGAGSSSYPNTWYWKLAGQLQVYFNRGTTSDWAGLICATGGQSIPNVIPYLSHNLTTEPNSMVSEKSSAYNYHAWVVCTGRNDCTSMSLSDFKKLYRLAVRQGIRAGIDVICMTEPPSINTSDWSINDPYYPEYAQAIRDIAADEGASLVDVHKDFLEQYNVYGISPQILMADVAHPNDAGHLRISNLMFSCFTAPSDSKTYKDFDDEYLLKCIPQTQFNMGTDQAISVVTANTARGLWKGSLTAVKIASGATLSISMPSIDWDYMIVTFINKLSTGTATVQSPTGFNVQTGITFSSDYTREVSHLIKTTNTTTLSKNSISIIASGGDVYVSGITVIAPEITTIHPVIKGNEVGTWATATLFPSLSFRESNIVGNTITVEWYGTNLVLCTAKGQRQGIVSITTDDLSPVSFDMYSASALYTNRIGHYLPLDLGYHKTVIKVETKNASATDNYVSIKELLVFSTVNKDNSVIARGDTGIDIYSNFPFNFVDTNAGFTIADNKVNVDASAWVRLVNL